MRTGLCLRERRKWWLWKEFLVLQDVLEDLWKIGSREVAKSSLKMQSPARIKYNPAAELNGHKNTGDCHLNKLNKKSSIYTKSPPKTHLQLPINSKMLINLNARMTKSINMGSLKLSHTPQSEKRQQRLN